MLPWKQISGLLAALALCVLILGTATPASAQASNSKITGTVLDQDGNPFAGVTLKLKNDRGLTAEGKTDEKGKYALSLPPGRWVMDVYAAERRLPGLNFSVQAGQDMELPAINYKEMIEKNPEAVAARKKQEEERNKFEAMKAHFTAGRTALDQAKAMEREVNNAPADQRESLKQQVSQLQQTAINEFQAAEQASDETEPNRHLILANLGASYEAAGNFEQAAASFQRAIERKPDQAGYYVGLANSLARLGKVDEAGAACEKIGTLDPPNAATCWRNTGIVLYNASKLKEAATPLRRATELDPQNPDAWYLLGASLLASMESKQVGDKLEFVVQPGTAEAYAKYLELAPNGRFAGEAQAALASLESLGAGVSTKVRVGKKKKG